MADKLWIEVDDYISRQFIRGDESLDFVLRESNAAGLPQIAVSAPQGKLLHLHARMVGARKILEIGTLGGYSAIWMARALPSGGRLITLEADVRHAEVARKNVERAGFAGVVDVRLGRALDTLPTLTSEGPFDLFFIDADKASIPDYFTWAVKLSRKGSVIIVDNVVRDGAVIDPDGDASVQGVRRFNEMVAADARVTGTTIQTVGSKGYDGFALVMVE